MMMGTGSTMTMAMPMTDTASSAAAATGMSDMSGMSMGGHGSMSGGDMGDMGMNMYLKADFTGYPVIFKTLSANSGAKAFGIFVILFFTAFFFRGISFLSAYIEQRIFQNYAYFCENGQAEPVHVKLEASKLSTDIESGNTAEGEEEEEDHGCCEPPSKTPEISGSYNPTNDQRSPLAKFFHVTPVSIYRDVVRLILTFISTMIGYALMLAVMTFILPYFFAVILGISFGEIFFMRLSIAFGIRPPESVCSALH